MLERGSQIGRFVVVAELGSGGMGAVYAAHDPQLDRQVALKVMRNASGDEEDRVRMLREGQAMARVTHPNVITVYEVGTEGGTVFLAQELLDGGTLREWLEQPRAQHAQVAIIEKFIAAGRGLAAAHAAGLVHRDFKPDNVLLGKDGRVRVADFGLARAENVLVEALAATRRGGGPMPSADLNASPMSALTRTGAVMGTPMFMAPEQHRGERADARSDQFAFCVSLYHALYNAWPYDGKTAPALADAVIEGRLAPAPKGANVSPRLRKILLRGLATDPAQRYPSMQEVLAQLEQDARPAKTSRLPLLAAVLVVVVGGGLGAYAVFASRAKEQPVVAQPTQVPVDTEALTTEKGIVWLTRAIDKGQLDDAIEKYDMAGTMQLQANNQVQAAVAKAAGAYMRVLRGELKAADTKLQEATSQAGTDPVAKAYVDLAEAALAVARGQLPAARDRSQACAAQLEATAPALAAICHQLHGEAQAALGDGAAARKAYEAGLAIAKQIGSPERTSTLRLALAQLDLDEDRTAEASTAATAVQSECSDRGALGCEVQARILLARIRVGEGSPPAGAELLTAVKPATIETFGVRVAHAIALGEIHAYMHEAGEDNVVGLDRIEAARAQAEVRGFIVLMLEAKLARVRVLLVEDHPDAKTEYTALVKQARAAKIERIAHLAEAAFAELAGQPRAMLPADGGLPAVQPGAPGPE